MPAHIVKRCRKEDNQQKEEEERGGRMENKVKGDVPFRRGRYACCFWYYRQPVQSCCPYQRFDIFFHSKGNGEGGEKEEEAKEREK